MLDCLKHMAEYNPVQAECTEQEVWQGFAAEAGVTVEELALAYTRITFDGYYGPISDDEWAEQDGRPMPLKKAIAIMHTALEYVPVIKYTHPEVGYTCEGADHCCHPDHEDMEDPGPMFHEGEVSVLPETVKMSCFPAIKKIYGGWL